MNAAGSITGEPMSNALLRKLIETFGLRHFGHFPSPTAVTELQADGVGLSDWQLLSLVYAMRFAEALPTVQWNTETLERERQIALHAAKLAELLGPEDQDAGARRVFWGFGRHPDADYSEYTDGADGVAEVRKLREELRITYQSAREKCEWLMSVKDSPIEPESNRTIRVRFVYWLLLMAFWQYQLGRRVGASTDAEGQVNGPLVRFIQILSKGGMSEAEITGTKIRGFLRDQAHRMPHFQHLFEGDPSEG